MSTIKNFQSSDCPYAGDGCTVLSCFFYYVSLPNHTFSGISMVPFRRDCAPYLEMVKESENVVMRAWMEDFFVKKKFRPMPPELVELICGESSEMDEPSPIRPESEDE